MKNIELKIIKTNNKKLRITEDKDIVELQKNIEKEGLLVPIIIDEGNNIISGFKRVEIFKKIGKKEIPTIIKTFSNEREKIKFIIEDNIRYRKLYATEIMRSIKLLLSYNYENNEIAEILKIPVGYINHYLILSELPEKIKEEINKEKLSIKNIEKIKYLVSKNFTPLIFFLAENNANANTQGMVFEYTIEIILRDKINAEEFFEKINIKEIINNVKLNTTQKVDKVYKKIYELRYPDISTAQNSFNSIVRKYFKNSNVKISPPLNFEGDYIKLEAKLKKEIEVKNLIYDLESFYRDKVISKLKDLFI
ncbi:MAG TPA: ParB N-terminal domain-containing protein [bacterium]|nr:ParB N-terminal domain-containing protein [bacterium]HOL47490.1 ParB N-terminal domain-containing protein [bacterium]HPQ19588.1 ParB N-terminal domain-containing protein [bacterium]